MAISDEKEFPLSEQAASQPGTMEASIDSVPEGPSFSRLHEIAFIFLMCCIQLFVQAALGMVLVPLQLIGPSFSSDSVTQRSWFLAAYSLTVGTFVLIAGQLGDIHGHKKMLLCGWLWLGFWSLVAGLTVYTSSAIFFDVCRAMQGIGSSMMLPNGLAILGSVYASGRRKEMVFALFASTAPVGFVVGGLFCTLFAQFVWWPWGFYCTAIFSIVISVLAYFIIPGPCTSPSPHAKLQFDFWGAVFGVSGLVLINFAWNQSPNVGWTTPYIYITLILGILILALFGWHESRTSNPLLPMDVWSLSTTTILACLGLGWAAFGIWVFYTFQFLQVLRGVAPLDSVAQFAPAVLSGMCAAITTGYLLSRVRHAWLMCISSTAFFVGSLLAASAPVHQSYWLNIFFSLIIMTWGMDMSFPAATLSLSDMVPANRQGVTASLVNTVVNYSISIGLGIAGTVERSVDRNGQDVARGYSGARWTGVGVGGIGVVISLLYACWLAWKGGKRPKV